jgi:N-acetylglucosaminyldiphosphoundecaprenol N-acetyl-beta-D-mannosaminyltransferase
VKLVSALDLVCSCGLSDAVAEAEHWIETGGQGVICFANVHVVETARRSPALRDALSRADLVLADGAPIAWALGRLRRRPSPRVTGTDFFFALCGREVGCYRHFLLGSTPQTLSRLELAVRHRFPSIAIAGMHSPPFGAWSDSDLRPAIKAVNAAAPDVIWVGIGAPKQELWMDAVRGRVSAPVLAGIGAVFDFVSGEKRRAPVVLQRAGLEWAHRLACEPRRLAGRYLRTNTTYLTGLVGAVVRQEMRS